MAMVFSGTAEAGFCWSLGKAADQGGPKRKIKTQSI